MNFEEYFRNIAPNCNPKRSSLYKKQLSQIWDYQQNRIEQQDKAIKVLMEAIEFYGDCGNYQDFYYGMHGVIGEDERETCGEKAREAKQKVLEILGGGESE